MSDTLYKLQPNRTMYLRGFDHLGAGAALHSATDTGFQVSGVFRDPADFAVLVLWDADDFFNHPTLKYLPDTNFAGLTLDFDVRYTNLMPLNCKKFATIDWPYLDAQLMDGTSARIPLRDHATVVANADAPASATFTITASPAQPGDRLTLWYENIAFDYVAPTSWTAQFYISTPGKTYTVGVGARSYSYTITGSDTAVTLCQHLADLINAGGGDADVVASLGSGAGQLSLTTRSSSSQAVQVTATDNIAGTLGRPRASDVATALAQMINAVDYNSESVGAPFALHATASGADLTVTTTTGGYDANFIRLLAVNTNSTLSTTAPWVQMSGGASTATLHIALNFSALGLTDVRQMWLTFAPRLAYAGEMSAAEWNATFTNWTVGGPTSVRTLSVPGAGSKWLSSASTECALQGKWKPLDGFYHDGQASVGDTGSVVTIYYHCAAQHDVWLAVEYNSNGGNATATLDNAATDTFSTLVTDTAVVRRRKMFASVAAGWHTVRIHVDSGKLTYDHVIVSVPTTDVPAMAAQTDLSAALDYSTDHTYKLPPSRIVWLLNKLGLAGPVNEYIGVFWWNQRTNTSAVRGSATIDFSTGVAVGEAVFVNIGGQVVGKSVREGDTPTTVAAHLAAFLNAISVGVWAESAGTVLTVHNRSAESAYVYTISVWVEDAATSAYKRAISVGGYGTGAALVALGGSFAAGTQVTVTLGALQFHTTVSDGQTLVSIADALAASINNAGIGVTAWVPHPPAPNEPPLTVTSDASLAIRNSSGDVANSYAVSASTTASTARVTVTGTLALANAGTWMIDPTQDPPLNAGARAWHTDFYARCAAAGLEVTTSSSMELVNPPADYPARFHDGTPVTTDVGFAALHSTHCAFSSPMRGYQTRVYTWLAQAQAAAGLTPSLQCGEFCWWYFPETPAASVELPYYASGNGTMHFVEINGRVYRHIENDPNGEASADVANALVAAVNAAPDRDAKASIGSQPWIVRITALAPTINGPIAVSGDAGTFSLAYEGGMAYYDTETANDAHTALGRDMVAFRAPNDSPSVNGGADATFLRNRLRDYCTSITTAVKAAVPGTRFEILYPCDVNFATVVGVNRLGGALNHYVNLPPEWYAPGGSGFDRFKVEGLDFGAWNRNIDLSRATLNVPLMLGWPAERVSCITPVYRSGYAWVKEVLSARERGLRAITLWAFDHVNLQGLDLALPKVKRGYYVA